MSDEVWWVKRIGASKTYYAYQTRRDAECENGEKFIRGFYQDNWEKLKGPKMKPDEIITIRPLRIERVEAPHDR